MNKSKSGQNEIIEVKMTKVLIDIHKISVYTIFEMNHKGLRPIEVQLSLR